MYDFAELAQIIRLARQLSIVIIAGLLPRTMRLMSTPIALQPAWSWARTDWHDKLSTWLQAELPKILTILVVAFVLARLLGVFTRKLQELSRRNELPSRIRAQQLRTLASVIQSVGIVVIYFFALCVAPQFKTRHNFRI